MFLCLNENGSFFEDFADFIVALTGAEVNPDSSDLGYARSILLSVL